VPSRADKLNDRAISDYSQAIRLDPNYGVAYSNRGKAYYLKHDYDRAISDFDKAIQLDLKSAVGYYNRGSAYDLKGDDDQAIGSIRTSLSPISTVAATTTTSRAMTTERSRTWMKRSGSIRTMLAPTRAAARLTAAGEITPTW
jgi:tetratricopeptide (TPR) repeat protein